MSSPSSHTRAGFVTLVGLPNAGKSTLINTIFEQKLTIVSPKVQTTRFALHTIYNEKDLQIVFIDTPGIIKNTHYLMHKKMMAELDRAAEVADAFIFMLDASKYDDEFPTLLQPWINKGSPHITLLNKADKTGKKNMAERIKTLEEKGFQHILPFTATLPSERAKLLDILKPMLPEMPFYYEDTEQLSDRSTRFFCAEMIREQLYFALQDELPYESTVVVHEFKEKENVTVIYANIVVSKQSQKIIVIGKNGSMLNKIGTLARKNIEEFLGCSVYLDLHVKVRANWRDKNNFLHEYGFPSN